MTRFDQCAHQYAAHAEVQRELAAWLGAWLDDVADTRGAALEYGAGDGLFTALAAPRFAHLRAVDLSPRMAELGCVRVPGAEWLVGDAWQAEGGEGAWDAVLSASFLQWCPAPVRVLRRWAQTMKPGGWMLHGFYCAPTLTELGEVLGASARPLPWRDGEQWAQAFREAGLVVERMESETREFKYMSALALLRSVHGVGAVRAGQVGPGRLRTALAEYDQRFQQMDGWVVATWTFCRVLARWP